MYSTTRACACQLSFKQQFSSLKPVESMVLPQSSCEARTGAASWRGGLRSHWRRGVFYMPLGSAEPVDVRYLRSLYPQPQSPLLFLPSLPSSLHLTVCQSSGGSFRHSLWCRCCNGDGGRSGHRTNENILGMDDFDTQLIVGSRCTEQGQPASFSVSVATPVS